MLGQLIVCYLFLGGAGAGACFVLAVMGLLAPRDLIAAPAWHAGRCRSGAGVLPDRAEAGAAALPSAASRMVLRVPAAYRRLFAPGYAAALVALAAGVTCLVADVGRIDRVALLLTSPTPSFVAVGAWALVACTALAVPVTLAWGGLVGRWSLAAMRVLEVALAAASLAVMVYAGLLLQSLGAVPLWATPWLPMLFVLSSLSCGAALTLAAAQFSGAGSAFATVLARLAAVDAAVIALEAAVAAAFAGTAFAGATGGFVAGRTAEALSASARALVAGPDAWLFWGGFALAGLAVPLVLDVVLARSRRPHPALALATAACVLAGGLVMRYCVVEAGMHPLLAATIG